MQARPSSSSRQPRRKATPPSQTKFDSWLEKQVEDGVPLKFVFTDDPFSATARRTSLAAKVLIVDRYMLLLEFQEAADKNIRWVAKGAIVSCG